MIRRATVLLAGVALTASGCGAGPGASVPLIATPVQASRSAPSATPGSGDSTAPVSPSGAATSAADGGEVATPTPSPEDAAIETQSPFSRHDAPPGSVAEYLGYGDTTGGPCGEAPERGAPWLELAVHIPMSICAYEFAPGEVLDVDLSGPHGWVWRGLQVTDEVGAASLELDDLPTPIAGEYDLKATQGAFMTGQVVQVAFNTLYAGLLPDEISVGETTRLFVAGGPPDTGVSAYLYFGTPEGYRFTADLGQVALDANGEGVMALTPRAGDPPGDYMIIVPWPPDAESPKHKFTIRGEG